MKDIVKVIFLAILACTSTRAMAQYRDVKLPDKPAQSGYTDFNRQETGFWIGTEVEGTTSLAVSHTNMQYVGLAVTCGYRLSEYLRVGLGFGGRVYVNNADYRKSDSKYGMPLFVNVRGNIISAYDRENVPFWSVNVGGILNDGAYFSPTLGYSFGGMRNTFQIGVTYNLISFKNYRDNRKAYSYLGLKVGYEF